MSTGKLLPLSTLQRPINLSYPHRSPLITEQYGHHGDYRQLDPSSAIHLQNGRADL